MRYSKVLISLFVTFLCSYSYAQEKIEEMSAEDYRQEAFYAIKLIELMQESGRGKSNDLANTIECLIDSTLWKSHTPLRDKNKFQKYTPEEIKSFVLAHEQLLNALRIYRGKYPDAKCVR